MACTSVQKNNVGTVFRMTFKDCDAVVIDISSATTKELIFESADGARSAKAGVFATNGTDGVLDYTTEAAFLNIAGTWSIQGHVVIGAQDFYTDIQQFTVIDNL
jgi:hypothetical protein